MSTISEQSVDSVVCTKDHAKIKITVECVGTLKNVLF